MTKAYIYTHCATQEQVEKFQLPETINNQIHRCKKYAKEHKYHIIKAFNDIPVNGNTLFGNGISELYDACIHNNIKYVLVTSYDRLGRDIVASQCIKKFFQKSGIHFIFIDHPVEIFFIIDQLCDE